MRGSAFFESVHQIDIEIGGEPGRTPTNYYDGMSMIGVFPARYRILRGLMPDRRFVPARLAPGVGLVVISALEYRDTDVGPYNEVLIGAVLNEPSVRPNFPGRALLDITARWDLRHVFILHLPVTSQVALAGGIDFYNFPKFIAKIDFSRTADGLSCWLAEGHEPILTLSGATGARGRETTTDMFCHSFMDGQPQCAHFKMHDTATSIQLRPGAAALTLGERHPIAGELDRLLIARRSLLYETRGRTEAILFGPEHLTLPLIRRGLAAVEAQEHGTVPG